jgi:peptide chain release factor 1
MSDFILDKMPPIIANFEDVERKISDPEIIADRERYQELLKKHSELEPGVVFYRQYLKCQSDLEEAKLLLTDPEMKEMAKEEIEGLQSQQEVIENELQLFLLPKDPDDRRNALVEIRQGTGGDEASLFAYELYRMYVRYAETQGWRVEVMSEALTEMGGAKEVVFLVEGQGVYSQLKFESGTHRVQRVPDTEASGRIHTSAATVAIMPEAEEVDIVIDKKDIRVDTFRASGAGGQHINKTSSAIRITHIPTGVVVECQDERSQFQNKDRAMRMLRTRLYETQMEAQRAQEANLRKIQVGSGDRSEKIRTYNFPQSRVTDHRINFTVHNLHEVLSGKLEPVIQALMAADRAERMKAAT